jgi:alpha-glucosidase
MATHARLRFVVLFAPLLGFLAVASARAAEAGKAEPVSVRAPGEQVAVDFRVAPTGPVYRVSYRGKTVVDESPLGVTFQAGGALKDLEVTDVRRDSRDETYPLFAGKSATARDHYNEATVVLRERGGGGGARTIEVALRAYDDGAAFRYRFVARPGATEFAITSEDSSFALAPGATAWVLPVPNYTSHYEFHYRRNKMSELKPDQLIGLPLMVELPDGGPAIAITEANLTNYAGMYLKPGAADARNVLRSALSPLPGQKEVKVKASAPHVSPWRVIMIADTPAKLIESNLVANLNDPCAIDDTSWIKPGKVAFLWWNGYLVGHNGRRGAVDTETFKHYVDGAAELGFAYSSIDGLDIAWYGGKIPGYGEHDITVPVEGLDMPDVLAHAKRKGVRIRLWVASQGLRKYLDKALETYARWGVEGIMVDFIERDDQEGVNWIREVVEKAAKHKLTVTLHNCPKPTGLSRTYPNLLAREAVRNQEWNKWDPAGVSPEHNLIVPFTRMLAGPLDYHSGGFRSVTVADYRPRDVAPDVMGTRCHQLAMYVVYENPMPMAVDYPAAYRGRPGIDFLSAVPTTWDETRVIQGQIGDFITIARRKGQDWYVGSMTDATARELKLPLDFLGEGKFVAETWADDAAAGPNGVGRKTTNVTAADAITVKMIAAGGHVARIRPAGDARP